MPAFSYVAIDQQGRTKRGVVQADAARQARAGLREAGLLPMEISIIQAEAGLRRTGKLFSGQRISRTELALITRRFAMLLQAGLTVEQGMDALVDQSERDTTRRVLVGVRSEVLAGHPFAAALDLYPASFPALYRALIRTGEASGDLAGVVSRLADYLERRQQLKQSTALALLYPLIVATVALLIVMGLLGYVVPQVVEVFQRSHQALPFLTRAMLAVSDLVRGHFIGIVITAAAGVYLARLAYSRDRLRAKWQAFMLRIPVLGSLIRGIETARLASGLAILVASGVPLVQALSGATRLLYALPFRRAVEHATEAVREGASLQRALASSKIFPPIFIHLVGSGEATGRLGEMLDQAAKHQEAENEARIRLWTGILEPVLILAMGVVVLLVVLAILLPIIEVNDLIRP
jgi:general secretion pathway protein F